MLLSIVFLVAAIQPPRDARAVTHDTSAAVVGVVVTEETEARPVRRARVSLSGGETGSGRTTITDDEGRFAFSDLAPGRYTVAAAKNGWIAMEYGAKRPMRGGTPVPLKAGERASITIRLPRGSVITGIVTDEQGRPAPDLTVRAMRYAMQSGERRLVNAGVPSLSDERGVYRIYNLPAGEYIVGTSIGASRAFGQNLEIRLTTDLDVRDALADPRQAAPPPPERTADYAPTYYPGTASPMEAAPVVVRAGEERGGVDLAIRLIPTVRVEGTVTMPDGTPPTGPAIVSLVASGQGQTVAGIAFESLKLTRPYDDGTFEFTNVAPGQYAIVARIGTALSASTEIAVEGERVSGISLVLGPGITVSGSVRFEGTTLTPSPSSVRVTLQPVQAMGSARVSPSATVQPDGRFTLQGATPGRYRLVATAGGARARWTLRSSIVNGQDTLDVPLTLQPNQGIIGAVLTFSDAMAQLSGELRDVAGGAAPEYTIVLFAADQSQWLPESRRIQATRPAADGAYAFRNLPAGEYLIAAVGDAEPDAWYDPAFLQALVPGAMRITIADGQHVTQDLRLGGPPPG